MGGSGNVNYIGVICGTGVTSPPYVHIGIWGFETVPEQGFVQEHWTCAAILNNNNYMFPVQRLRVYLGHVVNDLHPSFPIDRAPQFLLQVFH